MTKEQIEKAGMQMFKSFDEMAALSKENLDAVMKATSIYAKGVEDMSRSAMAFGQWALESSMAAGRQMLQVKTLREMYDLQSDFAKASFDKALAEGTKLSELGIKVTSEALEPINARVNEIVERVAKPLAA